MITPEHPRLNQRVTILKALGHPSRLWIVLRLMEKKSSVQELREGLDQDMSTVSRHLLLLRTAGIIRFERKGLFYIYELNCDEIGPLFDALDALQVSPRTGVR